jgi:hypothetical protein
MSASSKCLHLIAFDFLVPFNSNQCRCLDCRYQYGHSSRSSFFRPTELLGSQIGSSLSSVRSSCCFLQKLNFYLSKSSIRLYPFYLLSIKNWHLNFFLPYFCLYLFLFQYSPLLSFLILYLSKTAVTQHSYQKLTPPIFELLCSLFLSLSFINQKLKLKIFQLLYRIVSLVTLRWSLGYHVQGSKEKNLSTPLVCLTKMERSLDRDEIGRRQTERKVSAQAAIWKIKIFSLLYFRVYNSSFFWWRVKQLQSLDSTTTGPRVESWWVISLAKFVAVASPNLHLASLLSK